MDRICENCKHAHYGAIGNHCLVDKRQIKSKDKCPNGQFEEIKAKSDCSGCDSDCGGCDGFWVPDVKMVQVLVGSDLYEIDAELYEQTERLMSDLPPDSLENFVIVEGRKIGPPPKAVRLARSIRH